MSSPSSCFRCLRSAALSPGGLCRECAATEASGGPTPVESERPGANSTADTATGDAGPQSAFDGSTASVSSPQHPGTASEYGAAGGAAPLPESPPGFELLRHLSAGGMGDVYLARECPSDRIVALKFLKRPENPIAHRRFVQELQTLAALKHPRIVGMLASDFYRAQPFFTMEYAPGGSLSDALKSGLPSPEDAVRIIRAVAEAVAAAHAKEYVHRDLKPSNVLLFGAPGDWGALKVADFGLVKRLNAAYADAPTFTEDVLGTPGYMPPEQVSRANGEIDVRADVYGLGATLFHLLTGRPPFVGANALEIVPQVLADRPPYPRDLRPEVPKGLQDVVLKCLAKDPADRYPTVAALLAALDNCEKSGYDPGTPRTTVRRRLKLWAERNRARIALTAAAVLISIGLVSAGRFLAPVPVPPEPEQTPDPAEEARKALAAHRPVTLIGEVGLPRFYRSVFEPVQLAESTLGDHTAYFQAFDHALVELFPDPGIDHYRIDLELRRVRVRDPNAGGIETDWIGFYFGYGTGQVDKSLGHLVYAVTFADHEVRGKKYPRTVDVQTLAYEQHPERLLRHQSSKWDAREFTPSRQAVNVPGEWRPISVEVSPDGVVVEWLSGPDKDGKRHMVPVARWDRATTDSQYESAKASADQNWFPGFARLPRWSPRMPFGLVSHKSGLAVRRVVVTPLQ